MTFFVSKSGTVDISVGSSPSRNSTPLLEMRNLVPGNVVKITANFSARTNTAGRANGFYFDLAAVNASEVTALTPTQGIFQGSDGWQSVTLTSFFKAEQVTQSPTEDIDFEVLFTKGDLSGEGQINNFVLIGDVVSVTEP